MLVNDLEQCTFWASLGNHNYVFNYDEEMVNLCKVIKMKAVKPPKKCVSFGHANVLRASGGCKGKHRLRNLVYRIREEVVLKNAAAIAYGVSMLVVVRNKRQMF